MARSRMDRPHVIPRRFAVSSGQFAAKAIARDVGDHNRLGGNVEQANAAINAALDVLPQVVGVVELEDAAAVDPLHLIVVKEIEERLSQARPEQARQTQHDGIGEPLADETLETEPVAAVRLSVVVDLRSFIDVARMWIDVDRRDQNEAPRLRFVQRRFEPCDRSGVAFRIGVRLPLLAAARERISSKSPPRNSSMFDELNSASNAHWRARLPPMKPVWPMSARIVVTPPAG